MLAALWKETMVRSSDPFVPFLTQIRESDVAGEQVVMETHIGLFDLSHAVVSEGSE